MSKRSPRSELPRWRITRIRSTPAAEIGTVEAPDAESAIQEAIKLYGITDASSRNGLRHGVSNDDGPVILKRASASRRSGQ